MERPDVRWDGISHEQIVAWTEDGRGAAVTELLEAQLAKVTMALKKTADLANTVLRKVDGGEWSGTAATVAAAAMRVLRDFDDTMGHHSTVNTLAAYGQSDNASWARTNVPPVVDIRPAQVPTGHPADVLNATEDFHDQHKAARDAQERARQVMRTYEAMTTDRIAALPPLTPAPQVVVGGSSDVITAGPAPAGDLPHPRRGGPSGDVDNGGPTDGPGNPPNGGGQDSGDTGPNGNGAGDSTGDGGPDTTPPPGGSQLLPATEPTATVPAGVRPPTVLPGAGELAGGHTPNESTPRGAVPAPSLPVGRARSTVTLSTGRPSEGRSERPSGRVRLVSLRLGLVGRGVRMTTRSTRSSTGCRVRRSSSLITMTGCCTIPSGRGLMLLPLRSVMMRTCDRDRPVGH